MSIRIMGLAAAGALALAACSGQDDTTSTAAAPDAVADTAATAPMEAPENAPPVDGSAMAPSPSSDSTTPPGRTPPTLPTEPSTTSPTSSPPPQ